MKKTLEFSRAFTGHGDFEAWYACQKWLTAQGYSFGSTCVGHPVAVLKGDFDIAKWRNLTKSELAALDGFVTGNFRSGPVTVYLAAAPNDLPAEAAKLNQAEPQL